MTTTEQDREFREAYLFGSAAILILMALMFFFGWLGGIKHLAEYPPMTDCRPPKTISDKVVATLVPDGSGGLRINCHNETILPRVLIPAAKGDKQ